jgi:signal peptidase I
VTAAGEATAVAADEPSDSGSTNSSPNPRPSGRRRSSRRSGWRTLWEYIVLIGSALVLASLIRAFLGLAFWIPSPSMVPTLQVGDRVVVSRLSYRMDQPHRGDIVVFQNPAWQAPPKAVLPVRFMKDLGEFVGIGQPKDKNYIKRVVGLPGDTIEGKNGSVWINGKVLNEPYLPKGVITSDFSAQKIPAGSYWMMGDNRDNSCDSRCFEDTTGSPHPFISEDDIVGRAFVRVWPLNRLGKP